MHEKIYKTPSFAACVYRGPRERKKIVRTSSSTATLDSIANCFENIHYSKNLCLISLAKGTVGVASHSLGFCVWIGKV